MYDDLGNVRRERGEGKSIPPEMIAKIDAVLERVKDPESGLPVGQLGFIKRFRYNEKEGKLYVFADTYRHLPKCVTCAAIAGAVMSGIIRDITTELQREFPDLAIEFAPA